MVSEDSGEVHDKRSSDIGWCGQALGFQEGEVQGIV